MCGTIRSKGTKMHRQTFFGRGSNRPVLASDSVVLARGESVALRQGRVMLRTLFLAVSVCTIIFLWGLGPGAFAQESEAHVAPRTLPKAAADVALNTPPDDPLKRSHDVPIRMSVDMVLIPVTITDPLNRLVTGLDKENFSIFEGHEEQEIRNFSSEDAPISLGVIFDMSGSMSNKIDRSREAVIEFFKTANPQDEFFMVAFSDKPEVVADFTSSVEDIQGKMVYTLAKGKTALLDAIYLGLAKMREAKHSKKALLIVSDGGDNNSRYTEAEIRALVREADVMIYGIGIYEVAPPTDEERLGPGLLTDITEMTGGRAFTITNPNELADVATKIGIELRNQYVLGYRPKSPGHDGKWRKIKVKLNPPKGLPPLKVYAKTGYYAPSQ